MIQAVGWVALATVWSAPFAFGAVERRFWIPLCLCWLWLGTLAVGRASDPKTRHQAAVLSHALAPVHLLFALQLLPMPASWLARASAGSYAAHFLPDPGGLAFHTISVSPRATVEAWFYFTALQGLFLAVSTIPDNRRSRAASIFIATALLLGVEGLWQSRSAHPFDLYGRIPVDSPQGLETSTFGPFHNRNHFATITALAAAVAFAWAFRLGREAGGARRLLGNAQILARVVLLVGLAAFLALATAASGSRSGTLAVVCALGLVMVRSLRGRSALVAMLALVLGLVSAGPFVLERMANFDFTASRLGPWQDMARVVRFFPHFGSGIGAFAASYWPYQGVVTYELWEHAHNEYLEWLVDAGLVGILVLGVTFRRLTRGVIFEPRFQDAAMAALVVVGVQATLDFPLRIPSGAGMLVALLAVSTRART